MTPPNLTAITSVTAYRDLFVCKHHEPGAAECPLVAESGYPRGRAPPKARQPAVGTPIRLGVPGLKAAARAFVIGVNQLIWRPAAIPQG